MYQRIKTLMVSPKGIINYINDKKGVTLGIFLFFLLLYLLPNILTGTNSLNYVRNFDSNFGDSNIKKSINYEIKDYQLNNIEPDYKIEMLKGQVIFNSLMIDAVLIYNMDNSIDIDYSLDEYKINNGQNIIVLFGKDSLCLYYANVNKDNISYKALATKTYRELNLNNLSFNSTNLTTLNINHKKVLENFSLSLINKFLPIIVAIIIIQGIISYLVEILIYALLCMILYRQIKIKFGKIVKIVIYCSFPYIISTWLQMLFGGYIFQIIGIIVTGSYIFKTISQIDQNNIRERS